MLQAHNRFIQTKEEINRRNSGINLEASGKQDKVMDQKNNNEAFDTSSNSNEKINDADTKNENIHIECSRTNSLKSVWNTEFTMYEYFDNKGKR